MLYKKNTEKSLSYELFQNPTSEYRATPFWAWNCVLDKNELLSQIECFKQMGFGGFHMHSRAGLATEYLGSEFMDAVKACVNKAKDEEMLAWLYDEDKWPSGFAGGFVTKEPWTRQKHLLFTKKPLDQVWEKDEAIEKGLDYLYACYAIIQDDEGYMVQYSRIDAQQDAPNKWYAYVCTERPSDWYNGQTYVDVLSKPAMDKFIDITYNAYKEAVGDSFGQTVPAIFTDEPQVRRIVNLKNSFNADGKIAWTTDFDQTFFAKYNEDLREKLPEIFLESKNKIPSFIRYAYFDHLAERFANAFSDNCGKWCQENNLLLTGHFMDEPSLLSQVPALGEAMRHYRGFGLPGIDILCDRHEYTTAKQAQSAAHQYGREGVLSELYGVTGWTFDFRGHKLQGDWQAALGVTVRVPHLSWVSMEGNAKRDYPASINYQSPWYKEYSLIEDYFARLNTVLTRGKPMVNVGMIHPAESYWLYMGPNDLTQEAQYEINENFKNITNAFLLNMIDFDYISESLLPQQLQNDGAPMQVGKMQYSTLVVPCCKCLRSTTIDALTNFKAAGGKLVFIGECPSYVDGKPSDAVRALYEQSEHIEFSYTQIRKTFADEKQIYIKNIATGKNLDEFVYQLRQDNTCRWLFMAHCEPISTDNPEIGVARQAEIKIKGEYYPVFYDTLSGKKSDIPFTHSGGYTIIEKTLYYHDSMLLQLLPYTKQCSVEKKQETLDITNATRVLPLYTSVDYALAEPNVMLLDMPTYAIDDNSLQGPEEIIRISDSVRKELSYPTGSMQPWALPEKAAKHTLHLQFTIESEIEYLGAFLALEKAERCRIFWNNTQISNDFCGYYVDKSIKKVALPPILKGKNTLKVDLPFAERTTAEAMYLLGDFGVMTQGCHAKIVEKAEKIHFGALTQNRLPFYGGNVTYKTKFSLENKSDIVISANKYSGALLSVTLDGKNIGKIVFSPYQLSAKDLSAGEHTIEFMYYGNRHNTFGPLHRADLRLDYIGPNAWRYKGQSFSYEYAFANTGILSSPHIYVFEK